MTTHPDRPATATGHPGRAGPGFPALLGALERDGVGGLLALCAQAGRAPGHGGWAQVADAVRLSVHALTDHPERLAPQLVGRLAGLDDPVAVALVEQATAWRGAPWLCPEGPALTAPGGPLLANLPGGGRSMTPLALTPDGRTALIGDGDLIRLWDLRSGTFTGVLEGHDRSVVCIAIAPDGRWAISGGSDDTVRLWNLEQARAWGVLEGHDDWVRAVAATPDGRLAVSGADDRSVRVWDLEERAPVAVLEGHSDWVMSVDVTPDGRWAVSGADDHSVRLWDLEGRRQVAEFAADGAVYAATFLPAAGRVLVAGGSNVFVLRSTDLAQVGVLTGHTDWIRSLAVSADERTAVSGSDDGTVRVWDLRALAARQVLHHGEWVGTTVMTPDATRLASAARDGTVKLWRLDRAPAAAHWTARPPIGEVVATPAGDLAVSGGAKGGLRVWNLATGDTVALFPEPDSVSALAVSGDGERVVAGRFHGGRVLDLRHLALLDGDLGPMPAAVGASTKGGDLRATTPDGRVAVTIDGEGTLRVWEPGELRVRATLEDQLRDAKRLAVDPAGRRAAAAAGCVVRLWDLGGDEPGPLAEFVADQSVQALALPGAGEFALVAGDVGGTLYRLRLIGTAR